MRLREIGLVDLRIGNIYKKIARNQYRTVNYQNINKELVEMTWLGHAHF